MTKHLLDLGTADVHQPGASTAPRKRTMAKPKITIPTAKAKAAKGAAPAKQKRGRRLHVRADLAPGGALHVRQMSDEDGFIALLPPIDLTPPAE